MDPIGAGAETPIFRTQMADRRTRWSDMSGELAGHKTSPVDIPQWYGSSPGAEHNHKLQAMKRIRMII
jgi:hypothetical protein